MRTLFERVVSPKKVKIPGDSCVSSSLQCRLPGWLESAFPILDDGGRATKCSPLILDNLFSNILWTVNGKDRSKIATACLALVRFPFAYPFGNRNR